MGKRKTQRVPETLNARIFGLDQAGKPFSAKVETLDISFSGARLAGVNQFQTPGETIGLEFNGRKARFLVVWVGRKGSKAEGQVGIRNVDPKSTVWTMTTPAATVDNYQAPHIISTSKTPEILNYLEYRRERRFLRRVPIKAGARIVSTARRDPGWGICTDINRSGCYVETAWPLAPESRLDISLRLNGREIFARGTVRSSKPNWGMGIEFTDISEDDKSYLTDLAEGRINRLGPKPPGN